MHVVTDTTVGASHGPIDVREIQLTRRPVGPLAKTDFRIYERQVENLEPGEYVVRNSWLSIDAATVLRVREVGTSYLPPLGLDLPMEGWAVGRVVRSESSAYPEGVAVLHNHGWRDHTVFRDSTTGWGSPELLRIPESRSEVEYVGALGTTGLTAWAGLLRVAGLTSGDVVFVSAGAGAVGGLVIQLAKKRGHTVVASAGSPEKVRYLVEELGADQAFCYRDGDIPQQLAKAAPEGIDVYFDNVGGDHLEAALGALRPGGRVALCGAIANYSPEKLPVGPRNLFDAIAKGLTLSGFLARMYAADFAECRREMTELIDAGRLRFPLSVYHGLDSASEALVDLLAGRNLGKVVVDLRPGQATG